MNHPHYEHPELVGEELVSHTFLDYINGILMDESLEDHSTTQLLTLQSNHAYQLIFNGFQDILMKDKASLFTSTCRQQDYCCSGRDAADDFLAKDGPLPTFGESVDCLVMCSNNLTYSRDRANRNTQPNCAFSFEDQHRAMLYGTNIVSSGIASANNQHYGQRLQKAHLYKLSMAVTKMFSMCSSSLSRSVTLSLQARSYCKLLRIVKRRMSHML
ncbi:hypothetical protein GOP47_0008979 [Adiantum capillus-veneris]|uniref:Uncharacterized protein n=1 Tax=Adiantum capillus-veneris TaxID=13818 RepID=A0A9D4ZIN3_ADICA|nr:hypothetical protein GOP47_0008979 [Adiantum capillus-veneris]